jgi:A/G-specific adenine glycosylase
LHTCAKIIAENYNGIFPRTYKELIQLPGIGPYTAAAIASIAFQEPVAVVDGNVFRVLARVFEIDEDIASPKGKILFTKKANDLIDRQQPDFFNQAMMEFGAIHCTPQNPKCEECIFSKHCVANLKGIQKLLPVKSKKLKVINRFFSYIIPKTKNKIWMKQRIEKDIWHGLYDFYLIETSRAVSSKKIMETTPIFKNMILHSETKKITHLLSHQKLHIKFLEFSLSDSEENRLKKIGLKPFSTHQVDLLPKPIIIQRYLKGEIDKF